MFHAVKCSMRASFSADAWQGGLGVITALEKTFMPGKGGGHSCVFLGTRFVYFTIKKKTLKIDFPTNEDNTLVVDSQNAPTPNLRNFQRAKHQAVVFDDISGPMFVWQNKKLMQQHIDGAQLGHSPTGNFTYEVWLWRVPVICTANKWDVAGSSLDASDAAWIEANCIVQHITEPVWIDAPP